MLRIASPPKKNAASSDDSGKNLAMAIPAPIKVDEIKRAVKSRYINMLTYHELGDYSSTIRVMAKWRRNRAIVLWR